MLLTIMNAAGELKRPSQMASRSVSITFTVAEQSAYLHKGTNFKEM
jgi:hypothetical protein